MKAWVYVLDEFRPVDIEKNRLLEVIKEEPRSCLKPLEKLWSTILER